ncbi:hypothetical protein Daus18300_010915 [Diaporthe australafricana]|uniref:Uncharacterized protein n=1 Tax=Diaporthe australafricana TaxID=127596 RepID=A0ABR3W934_9PEZI
MSPYDTHSSPLPKPVVEIKLLIKYPRGWVQQDTLRMFGNDNLRVGRDRRSNDVVIENDYVSRKQLEFYTCIFDDEHYPMVYVRDRESTDGTFVNGRLIGGREDDKSKTKITPGRIVRHGDIVSVGPDVMFEIVHPFIPKLKLNTIQAQEVLEFSDKYAVTNLTIGSGASAQVHLAIDQETGDYLVCKLYNLDALRLRGQESLIPRLIQETHVRSQIEHPNLATFRGAYKSHSTLYVFEDLATGGDLFTLTERCDTPMHEIQVRWLIRQVVTGAGYMHTKGLVHRDLKLENILCAVAPHASYRVVITDFGHTSMVGDRTMLGTAGTVGWQAPEIISPNQSAGPPADIWSIGVLAIYLLCGKGKCYAMDRLENFAEDYALHPPRNLNEPTVILGKIFEEVAVIRDNVAISKAAKDFIRRCFQTKPERRMTAAAALTHPWLCQPEEDSEILADLEKLATDSWKPRTVVPRACVTLNTAGIVEPADEDMDQLPELWTKVLGNYDRVQQLGNFPTQNPARNDHHNDHQNDHHNDFAEAVVHAVPCDFKETMVVIFSYPWVINKVYNFEDRVKGMKPALAASKRLHLRLASTRLLTTTKKTRKELRSNLVRFAPLCICPNFTLAKASFPPT